MAAKIPTPKAASTVLRTVAQPGSRRHSDPPSPATPPTTVATSARVASLRAVVSFSSTKNAGELSTLRKASSEKPVSPKALRSTLNSGNITNRIRKRPTHSVELAMKRSALMMPVSDRAMPVTDSRASAVISAPRSAGSFLKTMKKAVTRNPASAAISVGRARAARPTKLRPRVTTRAISGDPQHRQGAQQIEGAGTARQKGPALTRPGQEGEGQQPQQRPQQQRHLNAAPVPGRNGRIYRRGNGKTSLVQREMMRARVAPSPHLPKS